MTIKRWVTIMGLLLLAACGAAPDDDLPTLVRYPTLEATDTVAAVAQDVTVERTFPATFTPTGTLTPTATVSITATVTVTPSATITVTASPTATDLPTIPPENRPLLSFALTAAAATVLPADYVVPNFQGVDVTLPPPTQPVQATLPPGVIPPLETSAPVNVPPQGGCAPIPSGVFSTIYNNNPDVAALIGCATSAIQQIPAAWQPFEQGSMIWLNGEILILYAPSDTFQLVPDTFLEGVDPETTSEAPPVGLVAPIRGFLKVWSGNSAVRNGLGWATAAEQGTSASILEFSGGQMVYLPARNSIYVLYGSAPSGQWVRFQG